MTARLILICHGSTAAVRTAAFPADEPLEDRETTRAAELAARLPSADRCWTSPELRSRQTAQALRLDATVEPALRECDHGRWSGCTLREISEREPQGIETWLRDPAAAPRGGETIIEIIRRVGAWLAGEPSHDGRSIVVTHPTIIRAAIVTAIEAPAQSFWRFDVAPLSVTRLSRAANRWTVNTSGCAV
jgi:broad specificity phosphatase PhoE